MDEQSSEALPAEPPTRGSADTSPITVDTPEAITVDTPEAISAHNEQIGTGDPSDQPVVKIGMGCRVAILANLLLGNDPSSGTTWASERIADLLDSWEGPGTVVIAGNLLDIGAIATSSAEGDGVTFQRVQEALGRHPHLTSALRRFTETDDRLVLWIPGERDGLLLADDGTKGLAYQLGMALVPGADLQLATATGERLVRVGTGLPAVAKDERPRSPGHISHDAEITLHNLASSSPVITTPPTSDAALWQRGRDRLADSEALQRFLTSRLLYRRMARHAWWLLLPFAVALILRLQLVSAILHRLFNTDLFNDHPGSRRVINHAISRAHSATWEPRLLLATLFGGLEVLLLAAGIGWLSRKAWGALGGGSLGGVFDDHLPSPITSNDALRREARELVERGYSGLITGATLQAELTDVGTGFFCCPGVAGELVEEHPGRLGLPPVFLHHQQLAWIELETGADLHVRLLLARSDSAPTTLLERISARYRPTHDIHPTVVASHPQGSSWPPPPDLSTALRHSRRIRRWSAGAIAIAGAADLLAALTPPLRNRLHIVLGILPLGITQTAGALVALAGIGLLALARGIRRGQHRAWAISIALLALTLLLHLAHGGDVEVSILSAAVLVLLITGRTEYRATSDRPSLRSAVIALMGGTLGITVAAVVAIRLTLRYDSDLRAGRLQLDWWRITEAVVQRLGGVHTIKLPHRIEEFVYPSLLTIGISLAVVAVLLATRPAVDRHRSLGRADQQHARDIVRRHGHGTLDYFALRSDKQVFFHRDSIVAYAIHGGICLVAPDPIGPDAEREQVWIAFRRFAEGHGWIVAIMGASEEWLPIYRSCGMHDIYIGDEAVVDIDNFSLGGGNMKGLRQAFNRIDRKGYTASFHDPAQLDPEIATHLSALMSQSRRGDFERGFSMMLGRIFDPRDTGLLLCIVHGPEGEPAAMCQFVPASGIDGYSLDLMRRDLGEHPNGLIDFALVSTIEHLRSTGHHGLSLNFATLRSILEGERGDGVTQRVERWALRKMSGFLQIETLWRFNAKYEPTWLPRYVVYETAEHLVPVLLAIVKAESLWEVPVISRVLANSARRAGDKRGTKVMTDPNSDGRSLLPPPQGDNP